MRLIHRSIFKELLLNFFLSLLFLTFTLMMEHLLRLSRLLSGVGASVADITRMIFYLQPQILILTIPMALLLSTLLTYGRMNSDNELIIMRGAGISFRMISLPVAYLGTVCFLAGIVMSFYLSPLGSGLLNAKVSEILTTKASMAIEEGVFNTAFKDTVILVKEKPAPNVLSGIFIVDERKKDEPKLITANEGIIMPENNALSFSLKNGQIYITKKNTVTEIRFKTYNFKLNLLFDPPVKSNSELTPAELLKRARGDEQRRIPIMLEFHRRLSMPAICLIIIFLGPALSLLSGKSGKLGGLTIGLFVFAVYYTLLLYGENLSRSGKAPVFAGSWLSFLLLSVFAIIVFERVNKR